MNISNGNDKDWMLTWALAQGLSLLLLHKAVSIIDQPDRMFVWIWPAYAWSLLMPISLQMLAAHRRDRILWPLLLGFGLALLAMAGYDGWNAFIPGLNDSRSPWQWKGSAFVLGLTLLTSWFVLLPFAQYRLQTGRFGADYPFLFAASWRNALQLSSAAAFLGVFWALLGLWAALFHLLGIEFFRDLFTSEYFIYPATAALFGLGLALYQAREASILGLYRASLNILGWLLPLAAALAVGFLATLPFTGLEPLWKTGHATALMLLLQGFVLFLFNAAWQDGGGESLPGWLRRPLAGALVLLPAYAALCAYSLGLRVAQHGWSGDRVWAALLVFMLGFYGIGYAHAALRAGQPWMAGVAKVNVAAALTLVALLFATATPLLAPERIGVASQVSRLLSGQTPPTGFDYRYLRFQAGRWGNAALQRLAGLDGHPQAGPIRQQAVAAQKLTYLYDPQGSARSDWTAEELASRMIIYPPGEKLEDSFLRFLAEEANQTHRYYLSENQAPSPLLILDLNNDGIPEYILFHQNYGAEMFSRQEDKRWARAGALALREGSWDIEEIRQALAAGKPHAVIPRWQDVEIGSRHFWVTR